MLTSREWSGAEALGKRTKQILEKLPHPVFLTDPSGNVLLSNPATPISMGLSLGEFLQSNVKDCVKRGMYDVSVAAEASEKHQRVSRILTTRLGMVFVSTSTPIFDEGGKHKLTVTNAVLLKDSERHCDAGGEVCEEDRSRRLEYLFGHVFDNTEMVAESPAMRELVVMANVVARSDCTVMISGETGTGKEVLAKYIHAHSRRSQHSFVAVNCAALPETLAEAEFFGYERGSFTGARAEGYGGLFATADGGTLFLDEVGELPLPIQAKLLRVLDSGEVRRVGSTKPRNVNVRLIAATNRNLEEMVAAKTFRADLYYRLNVLPLDIRPLRERPEDIVPLAMKFWRETCRKHDLDIEISAAALRSLINRPWPGNVRELRHYIEREVIKAQAHPNLESLDAFSKLTNASGEIDLLHLVEIGGTLKQVLSQVEENYVRYMLECCDGRIGATAGRLGIYRTALHRKLKAYRQTDRGRQN